MPGGMIGHVVAVNIVVDVVVVADLGVVIEGR
jgi:hypothetical protein